MERLTYTPNNGNAISLEGPFIWCGAAEDIRSHEWDYATRRRTVYGMGVSVSKRTIEYTADYESANMLRNAADSDLAAETPGMLSLDGWKQRCYIVKNDVKDVHGGRIGGKLTLMLLDGFWWRERSRHFVSGTGSGGIDYEHDYEHDLGFSSGRGVVEVGSVLPSPIKIIYYGPCVNPRVTIADNGYQVDENIPSGSTVTIDALSSSPTVILRDQYGNEQSIFAKAVRDGGQGGGTYAFEKLKSGEHVVIWPGTFAFDVIWREQETEPTWIL